MNYLGIDPGKAGALALVDDEGNAQVWDYPGDHLALASLVRSLGVDFAAVEKVQAMPRQSAGGRRVTMGAQTSFVFGENFGAHQGVLAALGIPFTLVTPQQWQKAVLDAGRAAGTKERSLEQARRLYPALELGRKKDHGRADALHLARYARIYARTQR